MKKQHVDNGFDKKRYAELVLAAKGPNRTAQQFAADIGVPPSTLSRIINMKNSTASADRILYAIAENAADGSGVTVEMLKEANGLINRGTYFRQWEGKFEDYSEIIVSEIKRLGYADDDMEIIKADIPENREKMKIAVGAGVQYRSDLQITTKDYGRWIFEYKGAPGMTGSGIFHRWILMMLFALQDNEIDKASIVFGNKALYLQMKRLLDDVKTHKCISAILIDAGSGEITEEYCTGRKYGLWNKAKDSMMSLCDILKERYTKQYGTPEVNDPLAAENEMKYCREGKQELTEIFTKLGLDEQMELFKAVKNKRECYWFYQSEVPFINELLDDGSRKLADLKVGIHLKICDEDALHMYDRIRDMIGRRCDSDEEAERQTKRAYQILDIPMHKKSIYLKSLTDGFEKKMVDTFVERTGYIMSRQDDLEWLTFVEDIAERSFDQFVKLFDLMYEIRKKETGGDKNDEGNGSLIVEDYSGTEYMDSKELLKKALEEYESNCEKGVVR